MLHFLSLQQIHPTLLEVLVDIFLLNICLQDLFIPKIQFESIKRPNFFLITNDSVNIENQKRKRNPLKIPFDILTIIKYSYYAFAQLPLRRFYAILRN